MISLFDSAFHGTVFLFDPHFGFKLSTIITTLVLAGSGIVLLKAGAAWLADTEADAQIWRRQREQRRNDRAISQWCRRDPDAWWILRYPGMRIARHESVELYVHPPFLAQFKRDMLAQGYGPNGKDPMVDGAAERWFQGREIEQQFAEQQREQYATNLAKSRKAMTSADEGTHPNTDELELAFKRARERNWEGASEQLAYRHMIALADMFEGWSLDHRLTPEQTAMIVGWAESMRALAENVGPDWDPPKPPKLSLIGFLGRKLLEE